MIMFTGIHTCIQDESGSDSQSGYILSCDDYECNVYNKHITSTVSDISMMPTTYELTTSNSPSGAESFSRKCEQFQCDAADKVSESREIVPIEIDEIESFSTLRISAEQTAEMSFSEPCTDVQRFCQQDADGDTLLHIALILLSPELALSIIDKVPNHTWLNVKNNLLQTPIHLAVLTDQVPLIRRLVIAGADVKIRDKDGNMPIHIACKNNNRNAVRALLDEVTPEEEKVNSFEITNHTAPRNLSIKNCDGFSALHLAALGNNLETVNLLLGYGADVNVRAEKSGRTILHEAAWSGNSQLVKYLMSLGSQCDINARTYDGHTAFDLARSRGNWNIVVELATAGAKYAEEKEYEEVF